MRLGSGSHVYEIVEGWGRLPTGVRFGYTHGVVVDSQDRVYVHNQSKDAVVIFDREGNFIQSWGEQFADGAHGMFLNREGEDEYLYLADYVRHIVVKTTLDGEVIWTLGVPNLPDVYPSPDLYKPTDVAVARNGDFYVCDGYGQSWIHQYNAKRELIRSWGGLGSEAGKLNCPHGVWVDTRRAIPVLFVADRGNHRLQVFTLTGKHVGFVTEELRYPCCFNQFGDELYIPDLHGRVTILDKQNKLITHLGDNPKVWERPGWPNLPVGERPIDKFISPHAVCVDSHRALYVVEWISDGRLTKLRRCD
jgi:DNA-binding beta-propeller fold protein YncE